MVILKQAADQIILLPLCVITVGIVYAENVNVIQEKIRWRWFLEIIVNATTFLVIVTTENFVLVLIMESVNAENVFAIQNGIAQDTPPVNVEPRMIPASPNTESSLTSYALDMEHANVANANVKKHQKDNTLDNFVKIVPHVQTNARSYSHVCNVNSSDPDLT